MFWRVATFTHLSPIESLLDKDDITLEQLLDEDDLIQECKAGNARLAAHLSKQSVLEKLIQYLSRVPDNDVDFKYSYTACEIFVSELEDVLTTLIKDQELMSKLFSVLEQPPPLNSTLAGYFGRVVGSLLVKRTSEMHRYIQANRHILERLVRHVDTTSTMEVILRLVGPDEFGSAGAAPAHAEWIAQSGLMEQLLERLIAPLPESARQARIQKAARQNIGHILVAIADSQCSPLVEQLIQPAYLGTMLQRAAEPGSFVLQPVLLVCTALLDPKQANVQVTAPLSFGLMHSYDPPEPNRNTVRAAAREIVKFLPRFAEILEDSNDGAGNPLDAAAATSTAAAGSAAAAATTPGAGARGVGTGTAGASAGKLQEQPCGTLRPPLGRRRISVIELGKALLSTYEPFAFTALMECQFLQHSMRLFQEYPFNNILHHHVLEILSILVGTLSAGSKGAAPRPIPAAMGSSGGAVNGDASAEGGDSEELPDVASWLLDTVNLLDWLVALSENVDSPFFEPRRHAKCDRPLRAGYNGHITQLAQKIATSQHGLVQAALGLNGPWSDFYSMVLEPRAAMESKDAWTVEFPAQNPGDDPSLSMPDVYPGDGSYPELYAEEQAAFGGGSEFFGGGGVHHTRYPDRDDDDDDDARMGTVSVSAADDATMATMAAIGGDVQRIPRAHADEDTLSDEDEYMVTGPSGGGAVSQQPHAAARGAGGGAGATTLAASMDAMAVVGDSRDDDDVVMQEDAPVTTVATGVEQVATGPSGGADAGDGMMTGGAEAEESGANMDEVGNKWWKIPEAPLPEKDLPQAPKDSAPVGGT